MRINGEWKTFDDGERRPCVPASVQVSDTVWAEFIFLLDSGSDDTVLSADLLDLVAHLKSSSAQTFQLSGIGGAVDTITIETLLGFKNTDGSAFELKGQFSIFTQIESSDISLLGRDVTASFKVIYDRPDEAVMLLSPPHDYEIKTS